MSRLKVTLFPNGFWRQNCYVVSSEFGEALIIDPGGGVEKIIEYLTCSQLQPLAILNTHAHYDHVGAVHDLVQRYRIPFYLHGADGKLLKQANLYKILFESKENIKIPNNYIDLSACPQLLQIKNFTLEVIPVPGHTMGSVCFLFHEILFGGDTLMPNGEVRVDLPGGDYSQLTGSLSRLRELSGNNVVYPGHGKAFLLEKYWSFCKHV